MPTPRSDGYSVASGEAVYGGMAAPSLSPGNVYLGLWGQSNATGDADRADIAAAPLSSDPGLADFDAGTFDRVWIWLSNISTSFQKLQPAANNGAASGKFGPEFALAVRWMRETTSGNLYIHKETTSGAPISNFDPSEWPGSDIIHRMKNVSLPWLASQGVTINARHWFLVQGESNASDTQAVYQPAVQEIIDALYSNSILVSGSISCLAQMKPGSATFGQGVFDAKAAIAAANPTSVKTVQMDYYQGDNIHCTARGQVQLGYDAFRAMIGGPQINT